MGTTPTISQSLKRSKRWRILPAFTIDGYIDWVIYQGSITAAIFNDFIRHHVIPQTTPFAYGGPKSVIICDNASIHWNTELEDICSQAGVLLERLPPYSPDLNPIETSFSILKAWIKRHHDIAYAFAESGEFDIFLDMAVRAQGGTEDPRNLFRKSGIEVPE